MPDIWLDVDAALTEVPVNLLALLDDTDFKTREVAVAYNAAGMDLVWNFVTSAGVFTQTAVTPTTAGNYDWTHQGDGIYTIEIPASGGASINNDTEGYGWFTGVATGVLPWRGPVIGFRAAALNDALVDGGDNLDVNTVQWLGTACATPTVAGVPEVDLTHVAGATTNVSALATNVDAILTDTADMQPKLGTPAGASLSADVAAVKADTAATLVDTADMQPKLGTPAGASVSADIAAIKAETAAILVDTTEIGVAGAGLTNINLPNQTMDIVGNITGNLSGSVGSVTGNVGGNVTGSVGSVASGGISAASLATAAKQDIADHVLDRNMATGTDSGTDSTTTRTPRQALRVLRNRTAIAGGVATVTKEDDTTTSWTAAVTTAAGNPISEVNPT